MASVNNVFYLAGEPVKRYVKTVPSKVAGYRLDPMTTGDAKPIGFVLESSPDGFDAELEILAIYSEREDLYFRQTNKKLLEMGYVKEFTGEKSLPAVDYSNFMSDDEVRAVAALKTPAAMRTRLDEITSYFTVTRILKAAEDIGVKKTILDVIRARQAELAS